MKPNQNFLVAMLLSFAVIWGWQYFYVQPHNEAYKKAHLAALQKQKDSVSPGSISKTTSFTNIDRSTALANNTRLKIDTPELSGSIN